MLTVSYTPFTLQNFTESILVNVTNTASTNALPEGTLPALNPALLPVPHLTCIRGMLAVLPCIALLQALAPGSMRFL